jgi:L-methionine (R)-S-oxide reductase
MIQTKGRVVAATAGKPAVYAELAEQFAALIDGEPDLLANAANLAALVYHGLPELNWAGFYFAQQDELVLGPFQGKPACVRIAWGKGVCGTAAARGAAIVVPDVDAFPGHIACDAASRSELVVPLLAAGGRRVVGVLDLDSPVLARFNDDDRAGCEALVQALLAHHPTWPVALTIGASPG